MTLFKKKEDQRIAAYQRELIETHYAEVENMYKQIRGWRHDYRNHILSFFLFNVRSKMLSLLQRIVAKVPVLNTFLSFHAPKPAETLGFSYRCCLRNTPCSFPAG